MAERPPSLIRGSVSLGAWLDACLASLPGRLTRAATLILPSHRLAHRLRREACLRNEPGLLAGVRMRRPEELAQEILLHAGVEADLALPALRVVALRALLGGGIPLAYLRPEKLPDARSYADAIARTVGDLEAAGLSPADLRAAAGAASGGIAEDPVLPDRLRDIAALWEAADAQLLGENPRLRSPAGLLHAAAAELEREPRLAAPFGDVFMLLPLQPTSALLRFTAALGPRAVGLLAGRPERDSWRKLRDAALGAAYEEGKEGEPPRTELDLVQRYLFAAPEVLARRDRPRSNGPDGTVALEQHPGVQQEIDGAVSWVVEEVTERRTPLEAIAVVVPGRDPLAGLLAGALERADKSGQPLPAYVAGGLPLTDAPGGTLLRQLLVALHDGLESERTIALLPHLRPTGSEHLSVAEARKVVQGSGVVGGTSGNLERARDLGGRLRDREAQLGMFLEETDRLADDDPEKVRRSRGLKEARRLRESIAAVLPAAEALTTLAASMLDGTPLPDLWPAILTFYRDWCLAQPPPPDAARALDEAVREVAASSIASNLRGRDAVEYLLSTLETLRHPHGRHGEPRVFIGTGADVALLRFRAVRVMGAVEGVIPGAPREDPILPDAARLRLTERTPGCLLPTSADRVLRETHEIFLATTAASERLAMSASRQWVDGTEHELAGAMLETAVALGRPGDGGERELVPSLGSLRRLYVGPGNAGRASRDAEQPATVRSALRLVARANGRVHPAWLGPADALFSLSRLHTIAAERASNDLLRSDGFLGPMAVGLALPGLTPERGISASALQVLLGCPHRYLLENVLCFKPREEQLSLREVGQPSYGSLVHRVLEHFFRANGEAFCRRERTLAEWRVIADEAADACFLELLGEYPLAGDAVEAQRQRLRREVGYLVRAEWESGARLSFGKVEASFGYPVPVPLPVDGDVTLHVRGFIDRLDRASVGVVVRDFKTGQPKAREETDIDPVVDAQIGLYALVASGVMGGEKVARAAYVYPVAAGDSERAFEGAELEELLRRARDWFGLARELLAARSFPHTADAERCRYCAFQAVCGTDEPAVSQRKLAAAKPSSLAARFAAITAIEGAAEEDDAD